jgi:cyclopropane fatty-acyl-phospholipid synthase-like methyltransferase
MPNKPENLAPVSAEESHLFNPFSLIQLIKGAQIYKFKVFYEIKNLLLRYDERADYVNLGYWCYNDSMSNPSAKLVDHIISKLRLTSEDTLLNIGSGLGQPDIDIINNFPVKKIIGINISKEQVTYANNKFKSLNLDRIIEHHVLNASQIGENLDTKGITCVAIIEAIAEIPAFKKLITGSYKILPPGGRFTFCDIVRTNNVKINVIKKLVGLFLLKIDTFIYGDYWRRRNDYIENLTNNGFTNIQSNDIGKNVYPHLYEHVKNRFSILKKKKYPLILRTLTYLNIRGLALLYAWNLIDYTVFYAEKNNRQNISLQ